MQSQPPFNPYAQPSPMPGNGDQIGTLRERVATLEERGRSRDKDWASNTQQIGVLGDRLSRIETAGGQAIRTLPSIIEAHLLPDRRRLDKLEASWWEPLRPHLWKVYMGLFALAFAKGWRLVTGEPMPIRYLIEWFLQG